MTTLVNVVVMLTRAAVVEVVCGLGVGSRAWRWRLISRYEAKLPQAK